MNSIQHTLAGSTPYAQHRESRSEKVEDGFILRCAVERKYKAHSPATNKEEEFSHVTEQTYVCVSLDELLQKTSNYYRTGNPLTPVTEGAH